MYLAPIALALALAGCGGKESYAVGGTIAGLKYSGLELTNGSDRVVVPALATSYRFPQSIDYGDEYTIVIAKQPEHQTCGPVLSNSLTGSAGYTETIDVALACSVNTHKLIGTVTGLNVDGLVIINGNGSEFTVPKDTPSFTYTDAIPSQSSYGLVVLKQPAGKSCTIANGTGVMQDADVTNVAITCVPA
jgi:hypothetical protein